MAHEREITISKVKLIEKIKENKANHVKEYEQAVINYKKEATLQLTEQLKKIEEGATNIVLDLIRPIDNSKQYDNLLSMFEWELKEEVVLSHREFVEYILDETSYAIQAKSLNNAYLGKFL